MWSLSLGTAAELDDDWDLGAVVRSCRSSMAPTAEPSCSLSWFPVPKAAGEKEELEAAEVAGKCGSFLGFPGLLLCSDGLQELEEVCKPFFFPNVRVQQCSSPADASAAPPLSRHAHRSLSQVPLSKRRKNQQNSVVRRVADNALSSDVWAWRKYGQKPIKGSPYPRGYYRCSSAKSCLARKQVERNRADPATFVITYTAEHNHPAPTYRSSLAGSTRQKFPSLAPAPAAAAGEGRRGECGGSPTTPLIGTMEGEDDDDEDEQVLLVEDMDVVGKDDLVFMNDNWDGTMRDNQFPPAWRPRCDSTPAAAHGG